MTKVDRYRLACRALARIVVNEYGDRPLSDVAATYTDAVANEIEALRQLEGELPRSGAYGTTDPFGVE